MAHHNWGELLAVRIEQGAAECPPHIERALREVQQAGEVSAAAAERYRQRRLELCAACPMHTTCDRIECSTPPRNPEAEEH